MASDLTTLVVLTTMVMAVPGPSVVFAVTQRIEGGAVVGAFGVFGLETGLLVHVAACALGVSALVAASPSALLTLKVAGAAYLALLGTRQILAIRQPHAVDVSPGGGASSPGHPSGRARAFRGGLLVDLLNPKTVIFVLALLPQFIDGGRGPWDAVLAAAIVVGIAFAADLAWMLGAGWLWSRRRRPGQGPWTRAVTGTAFLGFACVVAAH